MHLWNVHRYCIICLYTTYYCIFVNAPHVFTYREEKGEKSSRIYCVDMRVEFYFRRSFNMFDTCVFPKRAGKRTEKMGGLCNTILPFDTGEKKILACLSKDRKNLSKSISYLRINAWTFATGLWADSYKIGKLRPVCLRFRARITVRSIDQLMRSSPENMVVLRSFNSKHNIIFKND